MDILDKIVFLLENSGKEQKDFASSIGVKEYTISEWKKGKTKSYMKYIDKIANYFGVSTDYLLGDKMSADIDKQLKAVNIKVEIKDFDDIISKLNSEELDKVYEYMEFLISQRKKEGSDDGK